MQLIFQSSTNCDTSPATLLSSTSNKQQQNGPAVTSSIATSTTDNDSCRKEYERITADRLPGLTKEDLLRSITYSGNRHRLAILANKLGMMNMNRRNHNEKAVTVTTTQPVRAIVCGGSITLGHGVKSTLTYSSRLERWLNDNFPVTMTMPSTMIDANDNTSASSSPPRQRSKHSVQNMGSHGADICAFAKRTNQLLKVLEESNNSNNNDDIDLFILEFAVNDYQGQDHISMIQWRTDTFFEGFRDIAACTESVLVKLLHRYPNAAILFLEMRTAVVQRKTAAVLHMGAAQHYQIPVISYDQAVFPGYHHLLEKLRPFQYTHVANDTVMPYPQGCHRCRVEDIGKGVGTVCHSVCDYQNQRGVGYERLNCTDIPPGRLPCYVPFLAHDDVHPSGIGHKIATDLIVHTIAKTGMDLCEQQQEQEPIQIEGQLPITTLLEQTDALPKIGFMVNDPLILDAQTNFVMVNDTYRMFVDTPMLEPSAHSEGFNFTEDQFERWGWIATNVAGNESITFEINLPSSDQNGNLGCYIPYLSVLKSYHGMGNMHVRVYDRIKDKDEITNITSLWNPRISIPNDVQLIASNDVSSEHERGCSGNCSITVTSMPLEKGLVYNKIKLLTMSVRPCIPKKLLVSSNY